MPGDSFRGIFFLVLINVCRLYFLPNLLTTCSFPEDFILDDMYLKSSFGCSAAADFTLKGLEDGELGGKLDVLLEVFLEWLTDCIDDIFACVKGKSEEGIADVWSSPWFGSLFGRSASVCDNCWNTGGFEVALLKPNTGLVAGVFPFRKSGNNQKLIIYPWQDLVSELNKLWPGFNQQLNDLLENKLIYWILIKKTVFSMLNFLKRPRTYRTLCTWWHTRVSCMVHGTGVHY